jgi:hypothetical protein
MLRFDPTLGTAGGFVVVRDSDSASHAGHELLMAAAEVEAEATAATAARSPGRSSVTFADKPLSPAAAEAKQPKASKEPPLGEAALKEAAKAAARAAMNATKKGARTVHTQQPFESTPPVRSHSRAHLPRAPLAHSSLSPARLGT